MNRQPDHAVVNRVIEYLDQADEGVRGHLTGAAELTQEVKRPRSSPS